MPAIDIPEPLLLDRLGGDEVYGYGQDGDVTIAANTTLTRDMYYNDLTINSSCTLDTNGYRVFVRGTLTFTDSTSKIGRFTNKTTAGTLKGGFGKGIDATDTLGGASGEQGGSHSAGNEFFKGDNEMFNLTVALLGKKFDPSDGTTKFFSGGSGGDDGAVTAAPQDGADGGDSNWSDYQTIGAAGGKGSAGNAATPGTGAVGGGVVLVCAKTISGDGTIRADGDDSTANTPGTAGTPAPNASTPGNTNPTNSGTNPTNYGNNPTNYGSNPTNYGSNNPSPYSYAGNPFTNYGSNPHTHYHWHPSPNPINNFANGFYHYHYAHSHPYSYSGTNPTNYGANPGNPYSYPGNGYSYPGNGYSYPGNNYSYPGNTNPTTPHPGGAGGAAGTASDGYNAGGGTVVLVSGTKPLPSGLTLAAAAGTGGTGSASAGSVITVYNISASDTDPGA
jgi:hypothetical protein